MVKQVDGEPGGGAPVITYPPVECGISDMLNYIVAQKGSGFHGSIGLLNSTYGPSGWR